MATIMTDTCEIDHIAASEQYRLQTFENLTYLPLITRRLLALAGFLYRQDECVCSQCGVQINVESLNKNAEFESNFFRKLHRKKVSMLGLRCSFLLCESGTNIDDLHTPLSSKQQPQWDDAEISEYINYTIRLKSFENWPYSQEQKTFVTPETMAKHGFYFSGPDDSVTCFYCGNTLVDWTSAIKSTNENIVQLEHARFFPCRFVVYTAGVKFVADAGYFQTVSSQERRIRNPMTSRSQTTTQTTDIKPHTTDECLTTYENWPRNAPISAQALADAGFYYLGEELRVKCFMCDLEVDDWRHGMTAVGTHRKRSNDCDLVRAIDSIQVGNIQTANEKWRLETLIGLSFTQSKTNTQNTTEADNRLCRELAACGFYRFKNTKFIRCAFCGVSIEPKSDQSIMSQHRYLTKQSIKKTTMTTTTNEQHHGLLVDCLMVRAQCPANIAIPHRERFPEYPRYQSIFDRINSFEKLKQRRKRDDSSIRDMSEAGFFLDEQRRMRCFQCGNSLPLSNKARQEKYSQYTMAQLHAHFYPTCEWVKEILGVKYIAQVLHDRYKSNEPKTPPSALSSVTVKSSSSSGVTASSSTDDPSPSSAASFDEKFLSDQSEESSDDENTETVAAPSTTHIMNSIVSLRSPILYPPSHETSTTVKAQTCSDPTSTNSHAQWTPLTLSTNINPFKQLHLHQQQQQQQQQQEISEYIDDSISSDNCSHEISSSISSPVDIRALHAYESNRLETFKSHSRTTFANFDVAHLAYVGFYLNAEGTMLLCPWCDVRLTEETFEHIINSRPSVVRPSIAHEPWTPMRVHRHANGLIMDQNHPWCTWVRREAGGLYPNIAMIESQMLYPEYPSYSQIEKRIQSFTSEWPYPSGSRLSNQLMAEAGFFYMGGGSVCCFYCGNKLQRFEPRDCPFEEHATFYPLCDFIQKVRSIDYVNRIILECGRIPQGRLKYERDGTQKVKRIIFDKSGATKLKSERPPVNRISFMSSRSINSSVITSDNVDNACMICSANPAMHEYDPCKHFPMCGECYARLEQKHLNTCMNCHKPATIRMRVPNTPLPQ